MGTRPAFWVAKAALPTCRVVVEASHVPSGCVPPAGSHCTAGEPSTWSATPAGLTSLALEQQEEEAWLPPPELLSLTRLRHLSIAGNDCS